MISPIVPLSSQEDREEDYIQELVWDQEQRPKIVLRELAEEREEIEDEEVKKSTCQSLNHTQTEKNDQRR